MPQAFYLKGNKQNLTFSERGIANIPEASTSKNRLPEIGFLRHFFTDLK